ncbi:hypothetical protein LSAT2_004888 [Lamellibrachia satsuma]|nr:hypothetical protein LSAT2_004888 [Lamellibrachia satsuma]
MFSLSESVIRDVQFRMSCYQDTGIAGTTVTGKKGDCGMREDQCLCGETVACVGSPTVSVKQFPVGSSCLLECSLIFLLPGRFKLAFDCHGTVSDPDTGGATTPSDRDTDDSTGHSTSVSSSDMSPMTAPPALTGSAAAVARNLVMLRYPALVELCVAQSGSS